MRSVSPTYREAEALKRILYKQNKSARDQGYALDNLYRFMLDLHHGLSIDYGNVDDYVSISKRYRHIFGRFPDLHEPRSYTEKLQWRKLFDRQDIYTLCCDKYRVRDFVAQRIGERYLIPLLQVCRAPEEIDYDALPDKFVIKTNHASQTNILVPDRSALDRQHLATQLRDWLATNYYRGNGSSFINYGCEWQYKNIDPLIVVERFMEDRNGGVPLDYKFYCFNTRQGTEIFVQVDVDRFGTHRSNFYDLSWNRLPFTMTYPTYEGKLEAPQNFDRMAEIVNALAAGFDHVRVDLYNVDGRIYFGEYTFTPSNGFLPFDPAEFDFIVGDMWDLSMRWDAAEENHPHCLPTILSEQQTMEGKAVGL